MEGTVAPTGDKISAVTRRKHPGVFALGLSALGIVFGDLGTSPLYTYQTIVESVGGHPSHADAIGLLSLVVWSLLIVISLKYAFFVMRADNHGEGGILALMSLVTGRPGRNAAVLIAFGLFGAALLYGDGVITPAISVLSALEGIKLIDPHFARFVLPGALAVLFLLFAAQGSGTARIGRVFGPVMLLWFAVIGALGAISVVRHPEVLTAIDPTHAAGFVIGHGWHSLIVLGGVFLALTGGEALYADMGHLGRGPIRLSWYCVVLPALLLSYGGQTGLLLGDARLKGNPFFHLAPDWGLVPLVILATVATIIASQAIITGAFSLTRQAMQLGWFPGLNIRQTSAEEYGQIYVPVINWTMMVGTLALAAGFGSSDRLAGAYGTAVSTTMLLTTAMLFDAMRDVWRWPLAAAALAAGGFLVIDLMFFIANLLKIGDGGWVPLVIGAAIYIIMSTWHRGIAAFRARVLAGEQSPEAFLASLRDLQVARVPGTAVFLSRSGVSITPLMMRHVAQMKALQKTVVSLTIHFENIPRVDVDQRAEARELAEGFWQVTVRFGFVDVPNLPAALACARERGCKLDLTDAVYFVARDEVTRSPARPRLPGWRRMLFGWMYRNAVHAADRFTLPPETLVEVGRQVAV